MHISQVNIPKLAIVAINKVKVELLKYLNVILPINTNLKFEKCIMNSPFLFAQTLLGKIFREQARFETIKHFTLKKVIDTCLAYGSKFMHSLCINTEKK
jgi:hypothetical protein